MDGTMTTQGPMNSGNRVGRSRTVGDLSGRECKRLHQDSNEPPSIEELARQVEELRSLVLKISAALKGQGEILRGNDDEGYVGILQRLEWLERPDAA